MATERIDIIVSERGTRVVKRNIEDIGRGAQSAQGGVQLLRRALGALGVALGARQLINLVDTFTNLQNRLRTVTSGTGDLELATERLFAVANRTRSSYEGTVEVYARTALAAKELGVSQNELINFTESLNQAVILSGASAQEANAALIQLSQGLASGALRGDELRSVLEQLPVVADVIAKSLGITRGELREMGMRGEITAAVILKAFREARVELSDRFGVTISTVGQAFIVLRNNVTQFIGVLDTSLSSSASLAGVIKLLAENVETLARVFAAVSIIIGVQFASRAVPKAILAVKALSAAILANPLVALGVALGVAIALLISFSDKLVIAGTGGATLADFFVVAFQRIGSAFSSVFSLITDGFNGLVDFVEGIVGEIDLSFVGILKNAALGVDVLIGLFKAAFAIIVVIFKGLPLALGDVFFRAMNLVTGIVEDALNALIGGVNNVTEALGLAMIGIVDLSIANPMVDAAARLGTQVGEAFEGAFNATPASDALKNFLGDAEARQLARLAQLEIDTARREAALRAAGVAGEPRVDPATQRNLQFQNFLRDLGRETELLKLNSDERRVQAALFRAADVAKRRLTDEEDKNIRAVVRANIALERQADALQQITAPREDYENGLRAVNELLAQGRINGDQFTQTVRNLRVAFLETQTDALSGFELGLLRVQEEFTNLADLAANTVVNAFREAENALVEFVQTGRLSFSSLIDSIIADLTRLAVRSAITAPLANALGFGSFGMSGGNGGGFGELLKGIGALFGSTQAGGGGGGNISGGPGLANGGSFEVGGLGGTDRNVLSINNRPVARVSRGEEIRVSPRGGPDGGGRPIMINFNISTPDANSFERSQDQIFARASLALTRASRRDN